MILKKISLLHFRNFENNTFYFNPFLTIIAGPNSVGKTNLLEAIFFVGRGSGFREHNQEELINSQKDKADVAAQFGDGGDFIDLRIILDKTPFLNKVCFVNRIKKRIFDYNNFSPQMAIFSPHFISVIDGQPADRRDFIDRILSSIDIEYKKRLINYKRCLKKRNKLLEREKNISVLKEQLVFWDNYLIDNANSLVKKRQEFTDFLNNNKKLDSKVFTLDYQPSEISPKRLAETFEKQLYIKKTLVGPQRDNYEIYIGEEENRKNVHKFGSRSEQRLALFWLLLNEIKLIQEVSKQRPILLLDDVFSELDILNKALILKLIKKYQTVITTINLNVIDLIDSPHTIIKL